MMTKEQMLVRLEELVAQVGRKAVMFENDEYSGCLFPLYFMNPDIAPKPIPNNDYTGNYEYGIAQFLLYAEPIKKEELQPGDYLAVKIKRSLHPAVYLGDGKIVHVFYGKALEISRLDMFDPRYVRYFRRVK